MCRFALIVLAFLVFATAATASSQRPPHYNTWLCIKSHEGSWQDSGAPYWGGLQMDWSFMQDLRSAAARDEGNRRPLDAA